VAEFVNFYLIPGLVLGSIYALGAIGITLFLPVGSRPRLVLGAKFSAARSV